MRTPRIGLLLLVATLCLALVGCSAWDDFFCYVFTFGSGCPHDRFKVHTIYIYNSVVKPDPNVRISGYADAPYCGGRAVGFGNLANLYTGSDGYATIAADVDMCVGIGWSITRYVSGNCPYQSTHYQYVGDGTVVQMPCDARSWYGATPSSIDSGAAPQTLTVQIYDGNQTDLSSAYGMPAFDFYNEDGELAATARATSISENRTSATLPFPSELLSAYSGSYTIIISNEEADGSFTVIGASGIDIYGNDPPPPPDIPCGFSTWEEYEAAQQQCIGNDVWHEDQCSCGPLEMTQRFPLLPPGGMGVWDAMRVVASATRTK